MQLVDILIENHMNTVNALTAFKNSLLNKPEAMSVTKNELMDYKVEKLVNEPEAKLMEKIVYNEPDAKLVKKCVYEPEAKYIPKVHKHAENDELEVLDEDYKLFDEIQDAEVDAKTDEFNNELKAKPQKYESTKQKNMKKSTKTNNEPKAKLQKVNYREKINKPKKRWCGGWYRF